MTSLPWGLSLASPADCPYPYPGLGPARLGGPSLHLTDLQPLKSRVAEHTTHSPPLGGGVGLSPVGVPPVTFTLQPPPTGSLLSEAPGCSPPPFQSKGPLLSWEPHQQRALGPLAGPRTTCQECSNRKAGRFWLEQGPWSPSLVSQDSPTPAGRVDQEQHRGWPGRWQRPSSPAVGRNYHEVSPGPGGAGVLTAATECQPLQALVPPGLAKEEMRRGATAVVLGLIRAAKGAELWPGGPSHTCAHMRTFCD